LTQRGYNKRHVLGLLAGGGTLGILIPPSIPMIIYGTTTGESVGKLFIAGIVPGISLTILFMLFSAFQMRHIKVEAASWGKRLSDSKKEIWGLLLPVIVIGVSYNGTFTPREAAVIVLVLSFIIVIHIYRKLT